MTKKWVNVAQLVEESRGELQLETQERNILWKISPLPEVFGDPSMLKLVMVNLLSNAVKFTRMRAQAVIEIGSVDNADEWVVYVRDNGAGFDMQYENKLFGLFQRLHRQEEFEGVGVGLANVRRIILRHGGRVWAEGAVDGGATFSIALPKKMEG